MRGEYRLRLILRKRLLELPPRARRIRNQVENLLGFGGTTSACAENTCGKPSTRFIRWNYLRVRGEYTSLLDSTGIFGELPPRARRILNHSILVITPVGTTSACAENTVPQVTHHLLFRNYLRVRGEYTPWGYRCSQGQELPPRARRIPHSQIPCRNHRWNYLRVRGEYS